MSEFHFSLTPIIYVQQKEMVGFKALFRLGNKICLYNP